jgi:hypothetical protein
MEVTVDESGCEQPTVGIDNARGKRYRALSVSVDGRDEAAVDQDRSIGQDFARPNVKD